MRRERIKAWMPYAERVPALWPTPGSVLRFFKPATEAKKPGAQDGQRRRAASSRFARTGPHPKVKRWSAPTTGRDGSSAFIWRPRKSTDRRRPAVAPRPRRGHSTRAKPTTAAANPFAASRSYRSSDGASRRRTASATESTSRVHRASRVENGRVPFDIDPPLARASRARASLARRRRAGSVDAVFICGEQLFQ